MDKMRMQTVNKADENYKKLAELFPNAVTETIDPTTGEVVRAVDKDVLMQEINTKVVEGNEERYQFTWPDKKKSVLLANAPINKTLRPCREESVDFDHTENLYIEGDNLEVLKLLQETYLGKIKMIYIDPPYNTGNDFVYEDDFAQSTEEYLDNSGQFDEEGNRLVKNLDSNGRFHTDWLNMLYPRLKLAKDLLSDEGVIFISIDENEQENLKKICDEVYGTDNFINLICLKTKASAGASGGGEDKKLKKNTEYVYIYCKNYRCCKIEHPRKYIKISEYIKEHKANKVGFYYTRILESFGEKKLVKDTGKMKIYMHSNFKFSTITEKMKEDNLSIDAVYSKYYDKIFMVTNAQTSILSKVNAIINDAQKLVSYEYVPESGKDKGTLTTKYIWNNTLVVWFADSAIKNGSSVYKSMQMGTLWDDISWGRLDLQGRVPFKNGKKPVKLLERILRMSESKEDMILDFFSGSASTADAVMRLNAKDGGKRKFIMVQLPEKTDEKSEAYKAGYKNICEIGKERIRRAAGKIAEENPEAEFDGGFRVLKCDSSNMKDVYYQSSEYEPSLFSSLEDNIKEDRTPEDLLFQVMLDLGVLLSSKIEETTIAGKKVFNVEDNYLIACFDDDVTEEVITEIAKQQPSYFVMRDSSMASDSVATNFEQIFATYSPSTERRVL